MAIETSHFFSILLKYMATTKFNRAIDLQIEIAQMAVLENIFKKVLHWNREKIENVSFRNFLSITARKSYGISNMIIFETVTR